jgi:2'-5' RNA ligase superfamily
MENSGAEAAQQSAVLVLVPEAEPVVGRHRAVLDGAAAQGMPAHVTVLYPFVAAAAITEETLRAVADAVGSVAAFDCVFGRTAWFGDQVLWLAPDPDGPFRELTSAVLAAFPGYLPYDGAFPDVIPHLTIGEQPPGGPAALRAAEADVLPALPVTTRISRAWVMTGSSAPNSWHPIAELPLAAAD